MRGVYRTSALPAPTRTTLPWGVGERLVLHLPLSLDEVVEKISHLSTLGRHRPNSADRRPFVGPVQAPEFSLVPTARRSAALRVRGFIRPDGSNCLLVLEIRIATRTFAVVGGLLGLVVVALVASGAPAEGVIVVAARIGISLAVAAIWAFVSLRVGASHIRKTILMALDPSAALAVAVAVGDLNQRDLTPEQLIERLEEWARRPPK